MMNDHGILEIDGKRAEVARKDICRLKLILDELGIMHIIDDVTFCGAYDATEVAEESQSRELCSVKEGGKLSPNNSSVQFRHLEFRELIIPHFSLIDVKSLTQLDCEEAEFFGDLLYDAE